MKVIGITGGVGSGKSLVLQYLSKTPDVVVYEADKIAHDLQKQGTQCYEKIIAHFGMKILDEENKIDRKVLGNIVFHDKKELEILNAITHPQVRQKIEELIIEERNLGSELFILEAALLLEGNYQEICDEVWYIYCKEEIRRKRLAQSRGYTDETFEEIKEKQSPESEFLRLCEVVIDNSTTSERLYLALDAELERIQNENM